MSLSRWLHKSLLLIHLFILSELCACSSIKFPTKKLAEILDQPESCAEQAPEMQAILAEHNADKIEQEEVHDWPEMDHYNDLFEDMMLNFVLDHNKNNGEHFEFDSIDQQRDDCGKGSMAYDLVEHGIQFDTAKFVTNKDNPRIEQMLSLIPAPIEVGKKETFDVETLKVRRKYLEDKFHLKSPKEILSVSLSPNENENSNVIVTNRMITVQPKGWQQVTNQDGYNPIVQTSVMNDLSEMVQQTNLRDLNLVELKPKNQDDALKQDKALAEVRQVNQEEIISGFDVKSPISNLAETTTAKPIFGNSHRIRDSLARAASVARSLTNKKVDATSPG